MEKRNKKATESGNTEKIELKEETLHVGKREVETGRVRISKKVLEEEVPVDLSGFNEEIEIDRRKIGRVVETPGPAVREEGDSTVYSLYKEVYVKQVILEEEVWISKKKIPNSNQEREKLRKEVIDIQRIPGKSLKEDENE